MKVCAFTRMRERWSVCEDICIPKKESEREGVYVKVCAFPRRKERACKEGRRNKHVCNSIHLLKEADIVTSYGHIYIYIYIWMGTRHKYFTVPAHPWPPVRRHKRSLPCGARGRV